MSPEALAEELVRGAQEGYVTALTERLADMLARGVENPDAYAVALGAAREECMAVWAEWKGRVTEGARRAFEEAMAAEDEAIEVSLASAYGDQAREGLTDAARNAAAEAARGVAQIVARQNVALAQTAALAWWRAVTEAVVSVQLGGSRREAMERACAELARAGVETVDYKSGRRTTVDAAVRRHVVTQASQCRADLLERRLLASGHELVFTSAKWDSRPSHRPWQGQAFCLTGRKVVDGRAYQGLREATGYGTPGGLCGCNCGHRFFPYVPGRTKLPNTDFSDIERRYGCTGEEAYAAKQRQRALERSVRAAKREVAVGQSQGLDMADARARLGREQAKLRAHVAAHPHLVRDYSRERAYGVAEQPRALKLGVRENRAREDAKRYAVNSRTVGSKGWASALSGQMGACGPQAVEDARRMLSHRAGTAGEDLYAYDLTAGKRLDSVVSSKARMAAEPSERMRKRVAAAVAQGHEVATLHNHPGSSIPSAADVRALKATGRALGVIACHDGTLYVYRIVGNPAPGYTLDDEALKRAYYTRGGSDDEERAFGAIRQLFGVEIVHVKAR